MRADHLVHGRRRRRRRAVLEEGRQRLRRARRLPGGPPYLRRSAVSDARSQRIFTIVTSGDFAPRSHRFHGAPDPPALRSRCWCCRTLRLALRQLAWRAPRRPCSWPPTGPPSTPQPRATRASPRSALSGSGDAKLFNSMKLVAAGLAARAVAGDEARERRSTRRPRVLPEDIQDTFIKVIVGCSVGAIAAVGSDALGLDAGFPFTGVYLLAGIPAFWSLVRRRRASSSCRRGLPRGDGEQEKEARARRAPTRRPPALRTCSGCRCRRWSPRRRPRVVVFDEELAQRPGQFVSGEQVDKLAVVATSGLMAEASAYGKAVGASEDLALLNQILLRCNPPIPAQKQQDKAVRRPHGVDDRQPLRRRSRRSRRR